MRSLLLVLIVIFCAGFATAQSTTETKGRRTEVDSSGKAKTTTYTEVITTQDVTPRANMIIVNPIKFILFYNLSYFHRLNGNLVVGGGLQMPTGSGITGFGANAELRVHPSGKSMRGFYLAPNFSYTSLKYSGYYYAVDGSSTSNAATAGSFSAGVLIGWQWFPSDEFAMGLGIGMDYYWLSGSAQDSFFSNYNGTAPALRFDIGYAWE